MPELEFQFNSVPTPSFTTYGHAFISQQKQAEGCFYLAYFTLQNTIFVYS